MNELMKTAIGRFGALAASFVVAASFWVGLGGSVKAAPPPPDPVTCLPTCEATDGRFLVVAGNDPTTLSAQKIVVGLRFTEGSGDANFDIFDADPDETNWDVPFEAGDGDPNNNPDAPEIVIEVYADPNGVGGVGLALATFTPGGVPGPIEKGGWLSNFPLSNNAWTGLFLPQHPDALNSDGGYYQYAFHFSAFDPGVNQGWNAFKFRAQGTPLIIGKQVIGFLGGMNIPNDVQTIYPNFENPPDLIIDAADFAGSTYDGAWTFQTNLPSFLQQVTMFDGDMDFGNDTCTYNDTDDLDSSGVPVFAIGSAAVDEGVAQATGTPASAACNGVNYDDGYRTGLPSDDNSSEVWRRAPGIVPAGVAYQLKSPGGPKYPGGQTFINQNVSGNKEWEQFRIQLVATADITDGACPNGGYPADVNYPASDCRTDELPGGPWEVQLRGMDLSNLNFFFFDFDFQPPDPDVYSIGRLVWYDADKDGQQNMCLGIPCPEEQGIANVAYSVFDPDSATPLTPVRQGLTNATGEFLEDLLPAANYTVVVDAANFGSGQPLENLTSTTGGETETGIEVGLPVCTDVGVPVGCGDPLYAEAIFGYVQESTDCVVFPEDGGESFIGATHQIIPNPGGLPPGSYLTVRTTLATQFVDNTYGANAIGWPGGHSFGNLVGSDHVQLSLFDSNGVKQLQFKLDYITASGGAPGGYAALGVAGGEGDMILGDESNIVAWQTSLGLNFVNGMHLTVNSPATDANYTPNATYPDWIFPVWYDVTFKTDLFGGPGGFSAIKVSGVHASPSKTGNNTEVCLYEGDPGLAVVDVGYTTPKNVPLIIAAPGVLGNDTDPFNLPLTANLVTPPAANRGTITLNPDGSFTFTPFNNFTGDAKFSYRTFNGTSFSNTVENKIKVTK